jgi:GTP cyclohydrolase I
MSANVSNETLDDPEEFLEYLRKRIRGHHKTFRANDNLDGMISEREMEYLSEIVETRTHALLDALLIDTANDHNTEGTPKRMAKMFLHEVFRGRYDEPPKITTFPNVRQLDEMYVTGPITVRSFCSHHFLPFVGQAWIGVVPGEYVLGLSKFNRIVDFFASRPQIQEELVVQIADFIQDTIKPQGLAVLIKAKHYCMVCRGVHEADGVMSTSVLRGAIRNKPEARAEFMSLVNASCT